MTFSQRLPLSDVIVLCKLLRHYVSAGLTVTQVFRQQAEKGSLRLRPAAARIAGALEHGEALEDALAPEAELFPPLFVHLIRVGEQSGMVPEVAGELEKYFSRQQKLLRRFVAQITWPVIQFFLATVVLALLIWIMGLIGESRPAKERLDPLGLGLLGGRGAIIFLVVVYGTLAGLAAAYFFARRTLSGRATVDARLLRVPAIGPCLQALALTRFCTALALTGETGMAIQRALNLSMRATGNEAFAAYGKKAETAVKKGDELTRALVRTNLFPEEFLHVIAVGEESGQITEVLRQQAIYYDEEAGRRLTILAAVAGRGVWLLVAAFIVFAIIRLYSFYLGALNAG
jgi:type IV pilus assembly protein PilC